MKNALGAFLIVLFCFGVALPPFLYLKPILLPPERPTPDLSLTRPPQKPPAPPVKEKAVESLKSQPANKKAKKNLKNKFQRLMNKESGATGTLDLPTPPRPAPITSPRTPSNEREKGIKEREKLPLGVALWDAVPVLSSTQKKDPLYQLQTGDLVRVFPDRVKPGWVWVQPGVDLYLEATSKEYEIAGNRLPDQAGWVRATDVHIFAPEQALEFTRKTTPMTLGSDPDFSTLSFYERAMKNPDRVVHRVVGPRFIELLSLHEDYGASWGKVLRDGDSKIRSAALTSLRRRGLGDSPVIIEHLIARLVELTRIRALGELKVEALSIIHLLGETGQSRVKNAFLGFWESWEGVQDPALLQALGSYVPKPAPTPKEEKKGKKNKKK